MKKLINRKGVLSKLSQHFVIGSASTLPRIFSLVEANIPTIIGNPKARQVKQFTEDFCVEVKLRLSVLCGGIADNGCGYDQ